MEKLDFEMEIPEGIKVEVRDNSIFVSHGSYKISRKISSKGFDAKIEGNLIKFHSNRNSKRERTTFGTYAAHIKSMFKGVEHGHKYVLKICSGHFPMNVSIANNEITIKNFLGEAVPRKAKLDSFVKVGVSGDIIIVESIDKEKAGLIASRIEQLTKVRGRDLRVFQDGIYIIDKDGKGV